MHKAVAAWVEGIVLAEGLDDPELFVVELGSYDVNGSVRHLFGPDYLGIDMRPGPGVDRVAQVWDTGVSPASVDVVVSTEMLEHCERPQDAFDEIHRILKPGGCLLLTTRSPGYPPHDYPSDYYRFTVIDLQEWFAYAGVLWLDASEDPEAPGAFCYGRKQGARSWMAPPLTPAPGTDASPADWRVTAWPSWRPTSPPTATGGSSASRAC